MRPKKPVSISSLELQQAGQEELVLHDAVLDAGGAGEPGELEPLLQRLGHRLLAVDVLAGGDRLADRVGPDLRELRVEVDVDLGVGERRRRGRCSSARRPCAAASRASLRSSRPISTGSGQITSRPTSHAALRADREDRADQVLVHPHAPGHAVHGDPDAPDAAALGGANRPH